MSKRFPFERLVPVIVPVCPFEFYDGFELGNFSRWDYLVGDPYEIVTDPVKYGTYAAKSKLVGGTLGHTIPNIPSDYYIRLWFKIIGTIPTGVGGAIFVTLLDTFLQLYFITGGPITPRWRLYNAITDNWLDGTHAIPLDTWVCIEMKGQANNANAVHKLWMDGVEDISLNDDTSGYDHTLWTIEQIAYALGFTGRGVIDGVISDPTQPTCAQYPLCEG